MIARLSVASLLALVWAIPANAQSTSVPPLQQAIGDPLNFTLSGTFRSRYEALDGQFRPGLSDSDDLLTLRTTLLGEYHRDGFRVGAEVTDARAYGGDRGGALGTGEVNALELTQAYLGFGLGDAFGKGSSTALQFGRFTMDLGSRRLVGRNTFRNTTSAFTGARADWTGPKGQTLTLFYTLPHRILPSDKTSILHNKVEWDHEGFDLTFWGGFLSLPQVALGGTLELYGFGLNERDTPDHATRNRQLYTPGFRFFREPKAGRWDFETEAAYQLGTIRPSTAADGLRENVSAWGLHAQLGRQFAGPWTPRVSVVFDAASGDKPGASYGRFDSLFGPRSSDWGPTSIYGPLGWSNIVSPGVVVEAKPTKRLDWQVTYRAAWAQSRWDSLASTGVRDPAGSSGSFAGNEIYGRARYWLVPKRLRLEAGGAVLFWGRFLKEASNSNGHDRTLYGYTDLSVSF